MDEGLHDGSDFELLSRCKQGDEAAQAEVFELYVSRLIGFARNRLSARLSQRIDAEDVVQSAYRTFFSNVRDGRYVVERSGDLWRLLVGITYKKLHQQIEHHTAGKRSIWLEEHPPRGPDDRRRVVFELSDRGPTFDEALALFDELEHLVNGLPEVQQMMVGLRLQGASIPEIAAECSRSERTVRRVLSSFRDALEKRFRTEMNWDT